ncbi:MAG: DNA polymerase III subunit delta [Candidatus Pacebacteria bacterium]|nr:DNA polymerase III subunit delta [Candidatus Paceibacterota bacterium]
MIDLILIHGKNNVFSKDKLGEIIRERKQFFSEDSVVFDFSEDSCDFYMVKSEISNESMFFKKRVIVIKSGFDNKEFKEKFLEKKDFLEKNSGLIIFFEEKSILKTDLLYKLIKKHGHIYEFEEMDSVKIKSFLNKKVKDNGFKIEATAITLLNNSLNGDLWRLKCEIEKLMAFKAKDKLITKEDVNNLVKPEIESDIFKTIDAIARKDKKGALRLIHNHLEKGDSAPYIFSMIAFQFRNMLVIKNFSENNPELNQFQLKKELKGINPFVIQKSLWLIKNFSLKQLERIYKKIFQMDISVKSGKLDQEEAIEMLLLDI